MMRVLVVDDEPLARSGIVTRLSGHLDVTMIGECADGESALQAIDTQNPDLVFMDVQMPGLNGVDALGQVPLKRRPMVILLTAHDRYAVRAFELQVLDYLLKPVDEDRFDEALDRAREAMQLRKHGQCDARAEGLHAESSRAVAYAARFTVRMGHRTTFIDARQVDWIEASGDYAGLHVHDKVHLVREPLHQLIHRLDPNQFVRVHRSTVVRIDCIAELRALSNRDSLLRLHDGTPLRASRTYVDGLRAALASRCGVSNIGL